MKLLTLNQGLKSVLTGLIDLKSFLFKICVLIPLIIHLNYNRYLVVGNNLALVIECKEMLIWGGCIRSKSWKLFCSFRELNSSRSLSLSWQRGFEKVIFSDFLNFNPFWQSDFWKFNCYFGETFILVYCTILKILD